MQGISRYGDDTEIYSKFEEEIEIDIVIKWTNILKKLFISVMISLVIIFTIFFDNIIGDIVYIILGVSLCSINLIILNSLELMLLGSYERATVRYLIKYRGN